FLVAQARAARLELAATELDDRALDLARSEEAEPEEVPAPEHPLEVLEIPAADVIRGPEVLLGPGRAPDAPDGPTRRAVVLEDGSLVVRSGGVELFELPFRQLGDLSPFPQAEQRAAARQRDRVLEIGGQRSPGLELRDEVEGRGEARVGDQLVQTPLDGPGVV